MSFEHARWTTRKRPQADRVVPTRGGQRLAIRRYNEIDHGSRMAFEDRSWPVVAELPDRNAGIIAARRHAPVLKEGDRVHGTRVESQHVVRRTRSQRPD